MKNVKKFKTVNITRPTQRKRLISASVRETSLIEDEPQLSLSPEDQSDSTLEDEYVFFQNATGDDTPLMLDDIQTVVVEEQFLFQGSNMTVDNFSNEILKFFYKAKLAKCHQQSLPQFIKRIMMPMKHNIPSYDALIPAIVNFEIEKIDAKQSVIYFDITKQLSEIAKNQIFNDIKIIGLSLNYDGVPLYNRSTINMWPMQLKVDNPSDSCQRQRSNTVISSVYIGLIHPDSNIVDRSIDNLFYQLASYNNDAINCQKFELQKICCDLPAMVN
ncbi:hypothetical protein SNEBB_000672 [Seison nebaliae]|nr:hypothetical protein SNEBB_000672 [Seison nebaliae]